MKTYKCALKDSEESISSIKAESVEIAEKFFAKRKNLPIEDFLKIYIVKEFNGRSK